MINQTVPTDPYFGAQGRRFSVPLGSGGCSVVQRQRTRYISKPAYFNFFHLRILAAFAVFLPTGKFSAT